MGIPASLSRPVLALALLASGSIQADAADTLTLFASAAYTHDSNLFRLDQDERSENILSLAAGLQLDKPIRQQRLKLDASLGQNRYANYDFLNFDSFQYQGQLDWHLSPRVSGILSLARSESLAGFDNYLDKLQNRRIAYTNRLEADIWLRSNWHGLVGLVHDKQDYSQNFQDSSFRSLGWNVGVRYDRGNGRSLAWRYIQRDGDYVDNPGASDFSQRDFELKLAYALSDKTRLDGTVAYLERTHPDLPARDFDGWRADVGLDWKLSGKLGLRAEYHRRVDAWQDGDTNYVITNGVSLGPTWQITAKQRLGAKIEYDLRAYEPPATPFDLQREDDRLALALTWDWQPTLGTGVGAIVRQEHRGSNSPGLDYRVTSIGVSGFVAF